MERLTHEADFGLEDWEETLFFVKSDPNGAYDIIDIARHQGESEFDEILKNISLRLAALENILGDNYEFDRLRELVEADREGRCAILSEPMKPMVYKPNDTDVYCPNCGETLSGGWPLSDADDCRKMYQCFYCGQSIDTEKCEPYESDLKERGNDV